MNKVVDPRPVQSVILHAEGLDVTADSNPTAFNLRAPSLLLDQRAPRPKTLPETQLKATFLAELVTKHLYNAGALTLNQLAKRLALAGGIVEELVRGLRQEAYLETVTQLMNNQELLFRLTDRGRNTAMEALQKSGYIGPAPVPLKQYTAMVKRQSVHQSYVSRPRFHQAFANTVIAEEMLDRLGPALNSGKALMVYGRAGTGKTYITKRLTNLLDDSCLIPYALAIHDQVVQVFDPLQHRPIAAENDSSAGESLLFAQGHDPRYVHCRRPTIVTGGELSHGMLEVHFDADSKLYRAPIQLKANGGMLIIDDLGRQQITPADLFNRWIVPLEEQRDFLHLSSGRNFEVPFDVIVVFSTNLAPTALADDAFLRRIGHKIMFDAVSEETYTRIWRQVCQQQQIPFDPQLLAYLFETHYRKEQRPLLPCHPRDLLSMAQDQARYLGEPGALSKEMLDWAWNNYFVRLD